MFGLGAGEIVVILIVALLVLGPTQLPNAAKEIGKAIRTLRKHTRDLQDTIEKDEHIGGTVREIKSALRGDELFYRREPLLPSRPGAGPPEGEKPVAQEGAPPVQPVPADGKPAVTGGGEDGKPAPAVAEAAPAVAEAAAPAAPPAGGAAPAAAEAGAPAAPPETPGTRHDG